MGCVYVATCKVNGKKYVGVTSKTMEVRRTEHEMWARRGKKTMVLFDAIRKYGSDCFTWEVVFESDDRQVLVNMETYFIVLYNSVVPNGYNVWLGQFSNGGSLGGHKLSDETRQKISDALKGNHNGKGHDGPLSAETRQKLSNALKGRKPNDSQRQKISEALKGRCKPKRTDEHCRKLSNALKGNQYAKGHKLSNESRKRISNANKGRTLSDEHRQKVSEAVKAALNSDEMHQKLSKTVEFSWLRRRVTDLGTRLGLDWDEET